MTSPQKSKENWSIEMGIQINPADWLKFKHNIQHKYAQQMRSLDFNFFLGMSCPF